MFISYAHEDARLAQTFIKYFLLLWRELRYDERHVFYDAHRLYPGYVWEDVLRESLNSAHLLIFLVSADSLRGGHYCMEVEVPTAAQTAVPIVPVVLSQCPWPGQQIPGDSRGRTFGTLAALPIGRKQDVKPVKHKHWPTRDEAWTAVIDGLRPLLQSMASRGSASVTGGMETVPAVVAPDLLPYLCNQSTAIRAFDRGLEQMGLAGPNGVAEGRVRRQHCEILGPPAS